MDQSYQRKILVWSFPRDGPCERSRLTQSVTHSIAINIAAKLVILSIALCYYHNRRLLAIATTIASKVFYKKCSNRIELIIWINRTIEKTGKSNFISNWFEYWYEIVKHGMHWFLDGMLLWSYMPLSFVDIPCIDRATPVVSFLILSTSDFRSSIMEQQSTRGVAQQE